MRKGFRSLPRLTQQATVLPGQLPGSAPIFGGAQNPNEPPSYTSVWYEFRRLLGMVGNAFTIIQPDCCARNETLMPPKILSFPCNRVLEYKLFYPNTAQARVDDTTKLGDESATLYSGVISGNGEAGSAIYNVVDDKCYGLARKFTGANVSSHNAWSDLLIQFDPRTMAIAQEVALPAGWIAPVGPQFSDLGTSAATARTAQLIDVAEQRAFIFRTDTADVMTVDVGQAFGTTMFTANAAAPFSTNLTPGGNGMVLAMNDCFVQFDVAGPNDLLLVQAHDATNFTTFVINLVNLAGSPGATTLAESGDIRRFYLPAEFAGGSPKLFTYYLMVGPAGAIGAVSDLFTLQTRFVYNTGTNTWTCIDPFWDPITHNIVGMNSSGLLTITMGGSLLSRHGAGGGWDQGAPLGATNFLWQAANQLGAEFDQNVTTDTPIATYETTDAFTSPTGLTWGMDFSNLTYVCRRWLNTVIPPVNGWQVNILPDGTPSPGGVPTQGATFPGFG